MIDLLDGSENFNADKWWIGVVAPRSAWADSALLDNDKLIGAKENKGEVNVFYNRVKVKVVGYHDNIKNPYDLPLAIVAGSPQSHNGYGALGNNHMLRGGESVYGFWADGADEQKPIIVGVFYRNSHSENVTPLPSGLAVPSASTQKTEKTGTIAGKSVGTNEPIPDITTIAFSNDFDPVTGRILNQIPKLPIITNQGSATFKGATSIAFNIQHDLLANAKTEKPTCKRDNAVGALTGLLGDFAEKLIGAQEYANFYINGVTGVIQNLQGEIDLIAKSMAGIMEGMFNSVRNWIFAQIGKKIKSFIQKILPEEVKPIFGLSLKTITDTIYCIFENLIKALFKTISDFLAALVGKFINAPLCAAEEFIGALLNNLGNGISEAISPILNTLTETLGGALGSVNSLIDQALGYIGFIHSFIGCDEFKCPLPSRYDNTLGPSQKERDSATKIFRGISLLKIPTAFDKDGKPKQTLGGFLDEATQSPTGSLFKLDAADQKTASQIASLVGGCPTQILRCGPPEVEIFGGEGLGGFANAVVSNLGELIGADVVERGLGYSPQKPPYVTFRDACGNGVGARGRVIVGDDGGIDRIIIDYTGYGYLNTQGDTITSSGIIPAAPSPPGTPVTGIIDTVVVTNPGFGYNPGDTITIGNAVVEPVIIGGIVVSTNVIDPGFGFTEIPDAEINSETGIGAAFLPVLKFKKIDELTKPLDPAKVITIIDCISR